MVNVFKLFIYLSLFTSLSGLAEAISYQGINVEFSSRQDGLKVSIKNLPYSIEVPGMYAWGQVRRNANGDRLGKRYFWKQPPSSDNIFDQYYSKRCLSDFPELTSSKNFELNLRIGELDRESWISDWVLLKCLESRWYLKSIIHKKVYNYFYSNQEIYRNGYRAYKKYNDLWFKNLAKPEGERITPFRNSLGVYFYSRLKESSIKKWHSSLVKRDLKLKTLKPKQFSNTTFNKHTLIVTHATSDYDYRLKSKVTIDKYIDSFQINKKPVVFLMNNGASENWFTKSRNADETLFSRWGEHNYTIQNEVTVVGGQWKNCLRVTLVDLATRHFNSFNNDLIINLPSDAIYTEDGELLSESIFKLSTSELQKEIERTSIFGGYRIQYEDHHDGWVDVESDMNLYTGKPDLVDFNYDLYIKGKRVLTNIGEGQKKIIFKIL